MAKQCAGRREGHSRLRKHVSDESELVRPPGRWARVHAGVASAADVEDDVAPGPERPIERDRRILVGPPDHERVGDEGAREQSRRQQVRTGKHRAPLPRQRQHQRRCGQHDQRPMVRQADPVHGGGGEQDTRSRVGGRFNTERQHHEEQQRVERVHLGDDRLRPEVFAQAVRGGGTAGREHGCRSGAPRSIPTRRRPAPRGRRSGSGRETRRFRRGRARRASRAPCARDTPADGSRRASPIPTGTVRRLRGAPCATWSRRTTARTSRADGGKQQPVGCADGVQVGRAPPGAPARLIDRGRDGRGRPAPGTAAFTHRASSLSGTTHRRERLLRVFLDGSSSSARR